MLLSPWAVAAKNPFCVLEDNLPFVQDDFADSLGQMPSAVAM